MSRPKNSPEKPSYKVREIADELGCSSSHVYGEIKAGRLPHLRIGRGRIVIEADQWERYRALRRHTAEQAAERCAEDSDSYR